jgi:hypothetical protein
MDAVEIPAPGQGAKGLLTSSDGNERWQSSPMVLVLAQLATSATLVLLTQREGPADARLQWP